MKFNSVKALQTYAAKAKARKQAFTRQVFVCAGPGCLARGSSEIAVALRKELSTRKKDLDKKGIKVGVTFGVTESGCHGLCEAGPLVSFEPDKLFYTHVKTNDIPEIVEQTILKNTVLPRLFYQSNGTGKGISKYSDLPFYSHQLRIARRNISNIDPTSLDDYFAAGGFSAFCKVVTKMTPDDVVKQIDQSGLRGRGGGGFPTGKKWKSCLKAGGDTRYLICNGDHGDYFAAIEGMMIGAYALRTDKAYIYMRYEYPTAFKSCQNAINELYKVGLLGQNILGTDFSLDIKIVRGGGAFICGESSGLMRTIEGKVGEPRPKYIHSSVVGLFDKPTILDNFETWINVVAIIEKGATWFTKIGTKKSPGTKIFMLTGKVNNTGIIEVPLGSTLRHIIYDVGSGIVDNRPFKAVQTGGPLGGCLPESKLDMPVDFDTLTKAGSIMGSGVLMVMDDRTCMVDVAKSFVHSLIEESCGKCVPCREGLPQLDILLDKVVHGKGGIEVINQIERLCDAMKLGSLCGLGQLAPNPVLSTLQYFRDEYIAHLKDHRCPAGVCKPLITYFINDNCTGCMVCARNCPVSCITGEKNKLHVIDSKICTRCGVCSTVCKFDAVEVH